MRSFTHHIRFSGSCAIWRFALVVAGCVLLAPAPVEAYIGPGAGFAVGTTAVALFFALLSGLAAVFLWPFRTLIRSVRGRRALRRARVKRVVILGLDGMEPTLAEKYMAAGMMPNLSALKEQGGFYRLGTTAPPLSPVAWSTFLTGCNPGKHGIFDFLARDRRTYLPLLSSVSIRESARRRIGRFRLPFGRPDIRLLRKGKPFWNTLGEHGIFSSVIRVPITFPAEPFRGVLLSAMCVPDLRGTQGTFSHYSTRRVGADEYTGGERIQLGRENGVFKSHLVGPPAGKGNNGTLLHCPFELSVTGEGEATVRVDGTTLALRQGKYSPWTEVRFGAGLKKSIRGICQFLLLSTEPEVELYVTPIQIDPDKPAMPISHPNVFATYLSKSQGKYATLGLAEDTWGLNTGVLDDEGFLHQCIQADEEREKMFFDALAKVRRGLCVCVFDGTDRIQHMFWRYIDEGHPARNGSSKRAHPKAIEELYARMDDLVGRTMKECDDPDTVLMVVSDHGFNPFRRGVDWNVWLERNGYLKLKPGGRGKKYLAGVDWSQTKAFCLGLAGIWLNVKGREAQGIVDPKEADALCAELCDKMTELRDDATGEAPVRRGFVAKHAYNGPYKGEAPDIIIGYNRGYRVSWEAAIGEPTDEVLRDNTKPWSGDHCIDPALIPGVMFCNRRIGDEHPRLIDLGPTTLDLFGVDVPRHMDGRPLNVSDASSGSRPARRPDQVEAGSSKSSKQHQVSSTT